MHFGREYLRMYVVLVYESADDHNIQYVLSITGDNSHDYLVKVSPARI